MSIGRRFLRAGGFALVPLAGFVQQGVAQQDTTTAALEQRVEELDQNIRVLSRRWELYQDSVIAAAKTKASVSAGDRGFSFKSADGNFEVRFKGYLQADSRAFLSDRAIPLTNSFFLRRARPIFEATVYKIFDFRLMPDFGQGTTVLFDAYFEARLKPEAAVRVGKFKPPVDLERLQSATDIKFAERGFATNLAPNRDVGLQLGGDFHGGLVNYAVGVFDGVPDLGNGDNDISDAKDFAGRVLLQPFINQKGSVLSGLGLGVAGTTGIERGTPTTTALASYRTPGQQTFFKYVSNGTVAGTAWAEGHRSRLAPQAYFNWGPLGILGAYTISRQQVRRDTSSARIENKGWEVTGAFLLTGEKNSYRSLTPKHPFDLKNHSFGALELVARYGRLTIDDAAFPRYASATASAREAYGWGAGVNWYLGRGVKISTDYEETKFKGGAATGNRETEKFLATRFQTSF